MRTTYLLIIVFFVACIISAEVYIHQMKGEGFFEAPAISQTLWIIEWLFMLLAVCLTGISIGWYMQEKNILLKHQQQVGHLQMQRDALVSKESHFNLEYEKLQKKLEKAQIDFREDLKRLTREKERLREELNSWETHGEESKKKNSQLKENIELLEKEVSQHKKTQQELEVDLEKTQAEKEGLEAKLTKSFTLPSRDDLKLIHGIGPAIEKKLNALGIYSFRQISEFTPRTMEEVSNAIKFFPKRIERDNWVSQARNFETEKRRQL
jgi:predicted flap endonuclease-1-like 5' DNA nuclease